MAAGLVGALVGAALATELPDCRDLAAQEAMRPSAAEGPTSTVAATAELALGVYRRLVSPADGARCDFYPSCSGYALLAVRRNGPVLGAVMALERANRAHGGWRYTPCEVRGRTFLFDPPAHNDFWWRAEGSSP